MGKMEKSVDFDARVLENARDKHKILLDLN